MTLHRRSFLIAAGAAAVTRADAAPVRTPQMFGALGDGQTDNTEALQKMLDEGGEIRWPAGRYLTGRIALRSRTRILFEPGAQVIGLPGQRGVIRAPDAEDIQLVGQGDAGIFGPPGLLSHTVALEGAKRALVRNLRIGGGGADKGGKDALYIGRGTAPCEDVHVDGCVIHDGRRNGISVVECFGYTIENCDVSGASGAPGAGIDVEANYHGRLRGGLIRNNRVHDNQRFGIVVPFGDDVAIQENEVFDNGLQGIAVGGGGAPWKQGVLRPGVDLLPIASVDPATGRVQAVGAEGLEIGTILAWRAGKGAAPPREFGGHTFFTVVDNGPSGLLLAINAAHPMKRLSAPKGRLTGDLKTTALALRVLTEGQASNVDIYRNRCHGNGGRAEIEASAAVRVSIRENEVEAGADRTGVFATYTRRLGVSGNRLRGSTQSTSSASRGLHIGACSYVEHGGNQIEDFGYAGVVVGGVAGSYQNEGDSVVNCGWLPGGAPLKISEAPG